MALVVLLVLYALLRVWRASDVVSIPERPGSKRASRNGGPIARSSSDELERKPQSFIPELERQVDEQAAALGRRLDEVKDRRRPPPVADRHGRESKTNVGQGATPSRVEYARAHGLVAREEYMAPETEAVALRPGPDKYPDIRLERVRDRLLVVSPQGWVNPKSRSAYRAGLFSFSIRGTSYHAAAVKAGQFTPGYLVRLEREPENEHDPNAIAIYAERARNKSGYVPRGMAKRLAPLLDSGLDLVAVSTRGRGRGGEGPVPCVLVVERGLWNHLHRDQR